MSSSREELRNGMVPNRLNLGDLAPDTRRINALIRGNFAKRLPAVQKLQSHDANARSDDWACDRYAMLSRATDFAVSAGRDLIEIVVRIAHVRVFRLVTDFRREFRVTAMDVGNLGRQQGLIAVVPNRKRKGQNLNKTGHVASRYAPRSLPNAIAGSSGITFGLVDLVDGRKELSRRDDKVRDTAAEFARRTIIVSGRILNISERSNGKASDRSEGKKGFHRGSLAVK